MKAIELRIGNYVHYFIRDKYQDPQEWLEQTQIDAHDLILLSETEDADYRPIPITEDWLLKFGFRNYEQIKWDTDVLLLIKNGDGFLYLANQRHVNIFYIHQLQNLYFALTGEELNLKQQDNG
jgi:hypothetical protein